MLAKEKQGAANCRAGRVEERNPRSHHAFSADDADVQPTLPQVLLGIRHIALFQAARENLRITREGSTSAACAVKMKMFGFVLPLLQGVSAQFQVVLLMDTAPSHIGREIARRAAELHIWVIIFLPGLSWPGW